MQAISVNQFRANIKKVVDQATSEHAPIRVTRKTKGNFIVVGEEDWEAEQETLYVLQNKSLMQQIAQSLGSSLPGKTLRQDEIDAEFGV